MLSPREDDDDDTHLCIKCNATVTGLDNYVQHRKQRCGKLSKSDPAKPDLPPIDTLEQSYSLGADVFFQSLELQSSVKKTSLSRLTPPITKANIDMKGPLVVASTSKDTPRMSPFEHKAKGVWIGGHSLKIGSNVDNETKLINAVASISGAVKKDIPTSSYSINYNDFKGDEESDESDDSEEDDDEEHVGEKWKPPPNYTGGKWRPVSPDHEDWDMRDEQEHTGGKWKLLMPDGNDRDEDYDAPPPSHTKGKWVPGANDKTQIMQTTLQSKGSVQYWCGPCNRRLGSRAIYDKHLRSSLHLKKVLPEHELEFSGHLEPMKSIVDKRTTRPSRFINNSIYSQVHRKKQKIASKLNVKIEMKKRKRKPNFIHCPGCKSRVRQHLMGKHLISHYHFRKTTDASSTLYQQLILDNIDAIVHQSPFQCSPCKFYTNWFSSFMQHWLSEEHEERVASIEGRYWCSFCKFECDTSQDMGQHMSSSDHSEVIAVINRSMPIIIRKKAVLKCETCHQDFRYNIELKLHCIKTGHSLSETATDYYQEVHSCQICKAKFKSSLTLAAHLKRRHKHRSYLCLVCSQTFNTSEEAKRHRQTSVHRIKRKEKLREQGKVIKDLSKKCPYCTDLVVLKNILDLKEHIRRAHPDIRKKCPKCGMQFILSQEVTRHVRGNACQFQNTSQSACIFWNCSQCLFTTDSQAECFFHEVLHSTPAREIRNTGVEEKVVLKYACPLCPKSFRKDSLRHHLRQHTFERPFVCTTCGANFTRQTSLANHFKHEHGTEVIDNMPRLSSIRESIQELDVEWICGQCSMRYPSKSQLSRHVSGCTQPCDERRCLHDQCTFVATSATQLAKHRRSHGVRVKHHKCDLCPFQSDQASHLKRHLLCHSNIKPYACPHCDFVCRSLENLRKHVLRSGRHPGLYLYHCRSCVYQCNMATELRAHLTTIHSYDAKSALEAAKTHLMLEFKA